MRMIDLRISYRVLASVIPAWCVNVGERFVLEKSLAVCRMNLTTTQSSFQVTRDFLK